MGIGRFSVELSAKDWDAGQREMFLISFSDDSRPVECVALGRRKGGPRNTAGHNFEFTDFVFFEPIPLSQLEAAAPSSLRHTIKSLDRGRGKWFPPVSWKAALKRLLQLRAEKAPEILEVWRKANSSSAEIPREHAEKFALQRDAIGLSMDIAGMSELRRQMLRDANVKSDESAPTSFIELMNSRPQERSIVEHDRGVFLSLVAQGKGAHASFTEGNRQLHVWTVDKGRVEEYAGVDLVILNRDFNSLLLVQYKCMSPPDAAKNKDWQCRIDEQFNKEMTRMVRVRNDISRRVKKPAESRDARLHRGAMYFKFCKRLPLPGQDGDLAEGMFVNLDNVRTLLNSAESNGPQGGKFIGYQNCKRYLNNSLFSALARDGWIGTRGLSDRDYAEALGLFAKRKSRSLVIADVTSTQAGSTGVAKRRKR